MPSPSDFRKGFGFESKQGSFHGLQYTATVRHVVKTQFSVYEFPTTIVFTNASKSRVQKLIDKHLLGEKTIRSTYGNPYKCSFGRLTVTERDGEVTVRGRGVAVRDRSERAEEEKRAKKRARQQDEKPDMPGWRVQRSHFATGRCAGCGNVIDSGEYIVKRQGDQTRGGWYHAKCAPAPAAKKNPTKKTAKKAKRN